MTSKTRKRQAARKVQRWRHDRIVRELRNPLVFFDDAPLRIEPWQWDLMRRLAATPGKRIVVRLPFGALDEFRSLATAASSR